MKLWSSHFDLSNLSLSCWTFETFFWPLYNLLPLFPLEVSPVYLPQPEHRPRRYSTETQILSSLNVYRRQQKNMKRCDEKQTCEYCKFILHNLIKHIDKQNIISAWNCKLLFKERKEEWNEDRKKQRETKKVFFITCHTLARWTDKNDDLSERRKGRKKWR